MSGSPASHFALLLVRAKEAGAIEITFRVNLNGYTKDNHDHDWRWQARALTDPMVPHIATGRSGEESLRELVKFLEVTGPNGGPLTAGD